jgi:tight adherence protein B
MPGFFERFGRINVLFEQADTSLTIGKMMLIALIMAVVGAALGIAIRLHFALIPLVAMMTGAMPMAWVLFRRKRRLKLFASQLPEAMEMLARALRSGQSLGFGFNMVANEMGMPIGKEFNRVFEEQNLGIPVDQSLREMTERIPNLDLKFFVTAVILQRQTGGDLAEILDKIGELIRDRFRIWGQVQALTGEGRLSGIVLLALPFALFLAVYQLNPKYLMVLFTDPMGTKMLLVAIVMQLLGALVIRKIVNIKV